MPVTPRRFCTGDRRPEVVVCIGGRIHSRSPTVLPSLCRPDLMRDFAWIWQKRRRFAEVAVVLTALKSPGAFERVTRSQVSWP
jgi:hypothetical protein